MQVEHIRELLLSILDETPLEITRYQTGYCHYVFYVKTISNQYVIRVSSALAKEYFEGSKYWLQKLAKLNIPIPKIIKSGVYKDYSYMLLNYIPGDDLGSVYSDLSTQEKKGIIKDLLAIQNRVHNLPDANGYGYLFSYNDNNFKKSWADVLYELNNRSFTRIKQNAIFNPQMCKGVDSLFHRFENYFSTITPSPFLDDTTTKNVLIHNGKLSGIVDIDVVAFGDKLLTVGLTNIALMNTQADTDYIDYWMDGLGLTDLQRKIVLFYTLLFCLDFMGEKGMKFNKDDAISVTDDEKEMLLSLYHKLLMQIKS